MAASEFEWRRKVGAAHHGMRSRTFQLQHLVSDHHQAQVRRKSLYALVIAIVLP